MDAISFILSSSFTFAIRQRELPPHAAPRLPILAEIRVGFATVLGNPVLRSLAACMGSINFVDAGMMALFILFATQELVLGPAQIGLILGCGSASGLLGAIAAERIARRFGVGRVIVWGVVMYGVGAIPVAFAQPETAFPLLICAFLVFSLAGPVFSINQLSLRQAITPHRLQGRMNATMRFLNTGPMALGGLVGGWLGEAIGLRPAIILLITAGLSSFLWVYFSPVRKLQAFPEPVD